MGIEKSNQEKVGTTDVLQERDANVKQAEMINNEPLISKGDDINKLLKEKKEIAKELKTTQERISKINKEDETKRFKIKELTKAIESKTEREAELQIKIDKLLQEKEAKDKSWATLNSQLEAYKKKDEETKNTILQQEENKRVELLKQAETLSKKQNDPDILKLVENANDNSTRELLLNKFKNKKVDTIKVTALSSFANDIKMVNPLSVTVSEISQLKDSNPELYEDLLNKASNMQWQRRKLTISS